MNCPNCGKKMIPEIGCPDCDSELNIDNNLEHTANTTEYKTNSVAKKTPWYNFWYVLLGIALIGVIASTVLSGLAGAKIEIGAFKGTAFILAALFAIRAHQKNKSKILWAIIGLVSGAALAFGLVVGSTVIGNKKYGLQRMLKREAEKASAFLPKISSDGEMQNLSVTANDKTLSYKIAFLKRIKSDFDENSINSIKLNIKKLVCENSQAAEMLKSGIIIEYHYVDKNNAPVLSHKIDNNNCK